jgi:hypothetical protein
MILIEDMLPIWLSEPTFTNVVLIHLLEPLVLVLVLAYTHANSLIRVAAVPLIIQIFVWAVALDSKPGIRKLYRVFLSDWATVVLLQYIDTALISRWEWQYGGPTSSRGGNQVLPSRTPAGSRLIWAGQVALNQRWTNSAWAIKNIPPFSSRQPEYVPSRSRFVAQRLSIAAATYIVVNILSSGEADATELQSLFSQDSVPLFSRMSQVTVEEIAQRCIVTLTVWATTYCILTTIYNVISAFVVGVHLYEPSDWRPLFGSLGQLNSVRRFWNGFWQQGMRTRFSHPAHYIVYHLFGMRHGRLWSRYMFIFLAFAVSGAVHAVGDLAAGISLRDSGSIHFFCVQAAAIMFEDTAHALVRTLRGEVPVGKLSSCVGYTWTIFWLCWSSPTWHFPMLRNNEGSDADIVMPFDVVACLKTVAKSWR